ncbi:MAG: hypothetical protein QOE79_256 [Sphingomonadales bacterium]|jgi:hypothetical protein|nr:hypothetical protein [Sphingomonadales bacterium]
MKPIFLKLTLAACAAMVASPTFAQPEPAAAPATEAATAAAVGPMCRCPGEQVRRFRSSMLARKWAASVRCARGHCKRPCMKTVKFTRTRYMTIAVVRCRCRVGY